MFLSFFLSKCYLLIFYLFKTQKVAVVVCTPIEDFRKDILMRHWEKIKDDKV